MPEQTLTAKLQFQGSTAIAGMQKASGAFSKMQMNAKLAGEGIKNVQRGFAGFNIVVAGAAAGAAGAVKKFADFDGQMGAVKAVLGKDAAPEFEKLEGLAAKLGATTSFTATQSAEAMENLARAGFDATQIMKAVPQVLAAAAAEGMDLGTAADIVASNIKAFQLEAKDAGRVADALAFVSAKTNTNMVGLQEGLKFVAPVAKTMGIELEDTAAALGALADVGLKGTLAGTGLKNALLKLAKAAKGGKVSVGNYSVEVAKTQEGNVDLSKTMFNIVTALQKIDDPLERANASMGLLGLRGMGTAAAFDALGKNQKLVSTLFVGMRDRAKGAASGMQAMRLDTLQGDFTLLSSAVDGFMNSLGKALRDYIRPFIQGGKGITEAIGSAGQVITRLWGAKGAIGRAFVEQELITEGFSKTVVDFASGFVAGIQGAASIFSGFVSVLKGAARFFGGLFSPVGSLGADGPGVKGITEIALKAAALGVTIKLATKLFSRFAAVAKGSFQIIKGVLGGVKTGLGGTVGYLTTKFPKLANVLPGGLRKLTGAVNAAEKITAQPVRVVNFDEMGGLGGPRVLPGQQSLFGPEPAAGTGDVAGKMTRLGKAAKIAGSGVGLVAAAFAGWQAGKAIDEATGLSSSIADLAWNATKSFGPVKMLVEEERKLTRARLERGGKVAAAANAAQMAKMFESFSTRGIKVQADPKSNKKIAVTRELAVQKIKKRFAGESKEVQDALLKSIQPILDKLPTKAELAERPPTVIKIDGKEVARAVAGSKNDDINRGGKPLKGTKPRRLAKR